MNSHETFRSWEDAVTWLISQPDQQTLARDCYFDRPVIDAVQRYATSPEWVELRNRWLPKVSGHALDVGAGNGIVAHALASSGWHVAALEPDPSDYVGANAIRQIADKKSLPINVVEAYGEELPFDTHAFDLVIARQVMHHANDLEKMYSELARVLRPGGTLIAFRDHVVDSEAGLREFQDQHPLHRLYGGENAFRLSEYRIAAQRAGLEITKTLRQFESVINFSPRTKEDLCLMISSRARVPVIKQMLFQVLRSPLVFGPFMKAVSLIDRRQGRIVSFICKKPLVRNRVES